MKVVKSGNKITKVILSKKEAKKITEKNDPCWEGYDMIGTKTKNGKEVPNCVPEKKKKTAQTDTEENEIVFYDNHENMTAHPNTLSSALDLYNKGLRFRVGNTQYKPFDSSGRDKILSIFQDEAVEKIYSRAQVGYDDENYVVFYDSREPKRSRVIKNMSTAIKLLNQGYDFRIGDKHYNSQDSNSLVALLNFFEKQNQEVFAKTRATIMKKAGICDPTKEEMMDFLKKTWGDSSEDWMTDAEIAIYWFANDWHGGQASNLYSALSTSDYRPGSISDLESEGEPVISMYEDLENEFCSSMNISHGAKSKKSLEKTAAEYKGKKVTLNKPFRTPGGPKKFSVYVKNDKGNVVKVNFGDQNMEIKRDDAERRKSFRARHNCDNPGPKWKARYWSCKFWSSKNVSDLLK